MNLEMPTTSFTLYQQVLPCADHKRYLVPTSFTSCQPQALPCTNKLYLVSTTSFTLYQQALPCVNHKLYLVPTSFTLCQQQALPCTNMLYLVPTTFYLVPTTSFNNKAKLENLLFETFTRLNLLFFAPIHAQGKTSTVNKF